MTCPLERMALTPNAQSCTGTVSLNCEARHQLTRLLLISTFWLQVAASVSPGF